MKPFFFLLLSLATAVAIELEAKTFKAPNGQEVLYRFAAPASLEKGKNIRCCCFYTAPVRGVTITRLS